MTTKWVAETKGSAGPLSHRHGSCFYTVLTCVQQKHHRDTGRKHTVHFQPNQENSVTKTSQRPAESLRGQASAGILTEGPCGDQRERPGWRWEAWLHCSH